MVLVSYGAGTNSTALLAELRARGEPDLFTPPEVDCGCYDGGTD